jgi:hypothetical protein
MLDSYDSLCYNEGKKQGGKKMTADILGEMNQTTDTSEWESGEEEKNREQLEEMFGPQ